MSANFADFYFNTILYTGFPPLTSGTPSILDRATANSLFEKLANAGIQFNYMQGNCHNRAHIICLLLVSYGVIPAKIWAFAPGIFTVDNPDLISIEDRNHISPSGTIEWGYHVVPYVLVEENGKLETVVFDHAIFKNGPVLFQSWLEKLHIPHLLTIEMDWEWYLYNTLPWNLNELYGEYIGSKNFPAPLLQQQQVEVLADMPMHDFFMYELDSKENHWLEKGLAIDDTAYIFYKNEIQPIKNTPAVKSILEDYYSLVGVIHNFETVFRDNSLNDEVNLDFQQTHQKVIEKYRLVYEQQLNKWKKIVNEIAI